MRYFASNNRSKLKKRFEWMVLLFLTLRHTEECRERLTGFANIRQEDELPFSVSTQKCCIYDLTSTSDTLYSLILSASQVCPLFLLYKTMSSVFRVIAVYLAIIANENTKKLHGINMVFGHASMIMPCFWTKCNFVIFFKYLVNVCIFKSFTTMVSDH